MTRIDNRPRVTTQVTQQVSAPSVAPVQEGASPVIQAGISEVSQDLPPANGPRTLPAQQETRALGQNKGLLSYINARSQVGTVDGGGADPVGRFKDALQQRGAQVTELSLRGDNPPTFHVVFKSMEDFERARGLLIASQSGSPTFEGTYVQWRTGQLPPGA